RRLPDGERGPGKIGIGEGADGHRHETREAFAFPVHGRAALGAEAVGERVAALGLACVGAGLAAHRDALARKARLVAQHRAGAALAFDAVAHGDAHRVALGGEFKLSAVAGGAAGGGRGVLRRHGRRLRGLYLRQSTFPIEVEPPHYRVPGSALIFACVPPARQARYSRSLHVTVGSLRSPYNPSPRKAQAHARGRAMAGDAELEPRRTWRCAWVPGSFFACAPPAR